MNIEPVRDYLLLQEVKGKNETETESGIIIDSSASASKYTQVVGVGPDVANTRVGDKVLPKWEECVQFKTPQCEYLLVPEEHIVCKIIR